jgi:hypothetical protein
MIFIAFQNFGALSPADLELQHTLSEMKTLEKSERSLLQTPQSGTDFESVRNAWVERQGKALLNGADQRLTDQLNDRLKSWFSSDETSATADNASSSGDGAQTNSRRPASLGTFRFATINSVQYRFDESSLLTCSVEGSGAHVDFSKKLSSNTRVGVEHRSANSQTQVLLKYDW